MTDRRDWIYGQMADKMERDPYGPDGGGRAVVVNGRGFRWARFNNVKELVWVETIDGRMVGMTPWQAKVYSLARTFTDNGTTTIREMSTTLGCAPSTVYRALVKLMAWGLLGYTTARGRYAGTLIFRMHKGDGLDSFRQKARTTVKRWKEAAERRVSRLWLNVAPYVLEEGRGYDSLTKEVLDNSTHIGRNIDSATSPWTVQDLRDVGII